MHRSLARYSAPVSFVQAPSWADFITTMVGFEVFGTHRLLTLRVEVAKQKLREGRLSLRDVALACGFADQSHLTQVFARSVGVSPGAWRRALDE